MHASHAPLTASLPKPRQVPLLHSSSHKNSSAHTSTNLLLGDGVADALPVKGLVASAVFSSRVGGVVSVPVLSVGVSPPSLPTHQALML